jgi:hypothetical protein
MLNLCRYLVVDLMSGGDLRFHISRKTFTEEAVKFWIAELGCALRYIHKQGIIHRDVKPDNVLLDSEGHIHLADFVGHLLLLCERCCLLTLLECCIRLHRKAIDEQIRIATIFIAGSLGWDGICYGSGLVVVRSTLL